MGKSKNNFFGTFDNVPIRNNTQYVLVIQFVEREKEPCAKSRFCR